MQRGSYRDFKLRLRAGHVRFIAGLVALAGVCFPVDAPAATWNVSTVAELNNAVAGAGYGDEIVIAPGDYNLSHDLWMGHSGVTMRGATGNRDDVVLIGGGMNYNGGTKICVHAGADDITIMDLTISEAFWHGVQIHGEMDVDGTHLSNVRTLNIGQQHIKCSTNFGNPNNIADDGIVENCLCEQTKPRQNHPDIDYTGGVTLLGCNNWSVRNNVMTGIYGETGAGGPAIFLWQGAKDCTVENNVVIGCGKGIALGIAAPPGHAYMPNHHCTGGILRNNFVLRGTDFDNIALELGYTKDLKVYNNTVYSDDPNYFRTVHLYGPSTTNLDSRYNIIRGGIFRNGTDWSEVGNLVGATVLPGWFVDPAACDLHLTELALAAIDGAQPLADVLVDIDGDARPCGAFPDVGADEYVPEPAAIVLLGAGGLILRRRRGR